MEIENACSVFGNQNEQGMNNSDEDCDTNSHDDYSETVDVAIENDHLNCNDDAKPQVNDFIYMCTTCDLRFNNYDTLEKHFIVHEEDGLFACTKCEKSYRHLRTLKHHYRTKHLMESSKTENTNKSYICRTCGVPYVTEEDLHQHIMKTHVPGVTFDCKTCGKSFLSKRCLNEHNVEKHEKKKRFICTHCSRSFTGKQHLNRHVAIHSGLKPHKCDTCEAAFYSKENLKRHKVIHTGEKPFKCAKCEVSFNRKDHLRRHAKMCLSKVK